MGLSFQGPALEAASSLPSTKLLRAIRPWTGRMNILSFCVAFLAFKQLHGSCVQGQARAFLCEHNEVHLSGEDQADQADQQNCHITGAELSMCTKRIDS